MTALETMAWDMYCQETAGDMDVRDFWAELPECVQKVYLLAVEKEMAKKRIEHVQ